MARNVVLGLALIFVLALFLLILTVIYQSGITLGNLVLVVPSILVLTILGVGVVGALRKPPPNGR
jgi:hypothetical protein